MKVDRSKIVKFGLSVSLVSAFCGAGFYALANYIRDEFDYTDALLSEISENSEAVVNNSEIIVNQFEDAAVSIRSLTREIEIQSEVIQFCSGDASVRLCDEVMKLQTDGLPSYGVSERDQNYMAFRL